MILIVDDNDRYADELKKFLDLKKLQSVRAKSAREGWELFQTADYEAVITDITMETQTSGLWMIKKIHDSGFQGEKIIASTGFDQFGVMAISKYILPWFAGIAWMIPKVPLKKGEVVFVPTTKSQDQKEPSFLTLGN